MVFMMFSALPRQRPRARQPRSMQDMWLNAQKHHIPWRLLVPSALPEGCECVGFQLCEEHEPREPQKLPLWSATTVADGILHAPDFVCEGRPPWTTMCNATVVIPVIGNRRGLRLKQYHVCDYGLQPTHCAMVPPTGTYKAPNAHRRPGPRRLFELPGKGGAGSDICGWLGVDYAGCDCAQILLHGTMVEARITHGTFSDEELIALLNALDPVDGPSRTNSAATLMNPDGHDGGSHSDVTVVSLADSIYYARYPSTVHAFLIPSSLFSGFISNIGQPTLAPPRWLPAAVLGSASGGSYPALPYTLPARDEPKWVLDSVSHLGEIESISFYRRHHSILWVRQLRSVGPSREVCSWPPSIGPYPCVESDQPALRSVDGTEVYSLSCTAEAGPHEAAFTGIGGWRVLVHATPQVGLHIEAFLLAVRALVRTAGSESPGREPSSTSSATG